MRAGGAEPERGLLESALARPRNFFVYEKATVFALAAIRRTRMPSKSRPSRHIA
jgi:prophage maintenance system killer protein